MTGLVAKLRAGLLSLRDLLATAWWVILIAGAGFFATLVFVKPAPPQHIVIATGADSGAYYRFAGRYAAILAMNGIALEVRPSAGSVDNLDRLKKGEADAAFIQGGVVEPANESYSFQDVPVRSLGSVFYEPVWVFYRGERKIDRLIELKGKRLAIGQEGSGLRQLAQQLLEAGGLVAREEQWLPLSAELAADELKRGRIDAMVVIGAVEAPVVQSLLQAQGVRLMHFSQADGTLRRFPFLNKLVLPRGSIDLGRDFPAEDTVLLAATANLAVRPDLHPALQILLLQAASEVHGKAGFFQRRSEFPSQRDDALPLTDSAERYLKNGAPFLQRYLPFWLAVLVERLVILLVPAFALLLPLIKVAPSLYSWRIRSRVFRLYGELKFLEADIQRQPDRGLVGGYQARLDHIERRASELAMPLAFTDLIYTLREHINLVRQTLARLEAAA